MAVPNLSRALRGWTKKKEIKLVTKDFVQGEKVEVETSIFAQVNKQPVPAREVKRKPESQQSWKWWSIIIQDRSVLLNPDDIVIIDSIKYRVENASDWRESGFTKYQCVEDYQ